MNWLIRFSLRHRLLVVCLALIVLVYGGYITSRLPIDIFPNLTRPRVVVMTECPGLAPEEVEALVTFPLETALNGATGVAAVRSQSGIGLSVLYVEFGWNTDVYIARQIVNERLATVAGRIPAGVKPEMAPISSIMGQILIVGLHSRAGTTPPMEVRTLADWVVRQRLLTVPGVAQVIVMGGGRKQFQVLVDPYKLRAFDVSLEEVEAGLREANQNSTGGYVEVASQEFLVRGIGRAANAEEIGQTVVKRDKDRSILVRDVARVAEGAQLKRGDSAVNGQPGVVLTITKQPNADTRAVTEGVQQALRDLRRSLPDDLQIEPALYEQREFIDLGVQNVLDALRDGAFLVLVVLVLFLMNVRVTLITLTAIPLSIVITGLVFATFGLSINVMTLGGLAVAMGELVDDAIVDIENVFRRLKENAARPHPRSTLTVVYQASLEIRSSIVFGTLLVILVFIPLFALSGVEGRLFAPLGVAYIVSILASLLVSVTVTPVLGVLLLGEKSSTENTLPSNPGGTGGSSASGFESSPQASMAATGTMDLKNDRSLDQQSHLASPLADKPPVPPIEEHIPTEENRFGGSLTLPTENHHDSWLLRRLKRAPGGTGGSSASGFESPQASTTSTGTMDLKNDRSLDQQSHLASPLADKPPLPPIEEHNPNEENQFGGSLTLPTENHHDSWLLRRLKRAVMPVIHVSCHPIASRVLWAMAGVAIVGAGWLVTRLGTDFLPPFDEGAAQVNVILPPGTSLDASNRMTGMVDARFAAFQADERNPQGLIARFVRRTGRAELDEHAEGVHWSEYILTMNPHSGLTRTQALARLRAELEEIPGIEYEVEQPLAHLISHMLSGVSAQIAIKLYGDDLDLLRAKAQEIKTAIQAVPGIAPPVVEPQQLIPQWRIQFDREKLAFHGLTPGYVNEFVETALNGRIVSSVLEGQRTFDLVVRLDDPFRADLSNLHRLTVNVPNGPRIPLDAVATLYEAGGPNTIHRENVRRRITIRVNPTDRDLGSVVADIRAAIETRVRLPQGYFVEYGGQFEAQKEATQRMLLLSGISGLGVFLVLFTLYPSVRIVLQIMFALPIAFVGGVLGLWITGQSLSVASLVGFISLGGIAARNGILLVSHYLHLMREEGEAFNEPMVLRGSLERLAPVLMTALTAGIGLVPLVLGGQQPGKEILYPVATVILGGLITSTICEYVIHPGLFFWLSGRDAIGLSRHDDEDWDAHDLPARGES